MRRPGLAHLVRLGALATALLPLASGFSFNTTTPTQCGDMTVNWDGGTEPFYLIIVPTEEVPSGRIINVTIPTGLSQPYSHTFKLNEPAGVHFLATMYDSKGFGTGGTTGILRVGSSSDTSCLDSNLLYDFFFSIDPQSSPSQCSSIVISWNDNVTYPLNLYGLIPSGTAFNIPVPQQRGSAGIGWPVDISSGTEFLLFMSNAGQYQTGGSTDLFTVGSGETSCMNSTSPRAFGSSGDNGNGSNGGNIDGVGGGSSGGTSDSNGGGGGGGGKSNTGAIVGGAVGGVAFLVLLAILLWFCIRRNRKDKRHSAVKSYGFNKEQPTQESRGPLDLLVPARHNSDESQTTAGVGDGRYTPMPFRYPSPEARDTPNGTPGGPSHNIAGASAALAAMGNEKHLAGQPAPVLPTHHDASLIHPAYASSGRPSSENQSRDTGHTQSGTGTGLTPSTDPRSTNRSSFPPGAIAPSAWQGHDSGQTSEMGSEGATVGHVGRNDSTRKTAAGAAGGSPQVPQTPLGGSGVHDSPGGTRPLPEVPMQFVQHEDSGRIVDLPPRYDQLRTANPDP